MAEPSNPNAVRRVWFSFACLCAVLGGVAYMAAGAIHQDLPSGPENAVPHVAGRSDWYAVHLLAIVATALWPPAFAGIAAQFARPVSTVLGRLAVGAVVMGFVLYSVEMALDGYVLKSLADQWAAASGAEQDLLFERAATVYAIMNGVLRVSAMWILGIPFLLLGIAITREQTLPRWLGWIAAVLGAVVIVYTSTDYMALGVMPLLVGYVIPALLLGLWLVVIGIVGLRRIPRLP